MKSTDYGLYLGARASRTSDWLWLHRPAPMKALEKGEQLFLYFHGNNLGAIYLAINEPQVEIEYWDADTKAVLPYSEAFRDLRTFFLMVWCQLVEGGKGMWGRSYDYAIDILANHCDEWDVRMVSDVLVEWRHWRSAQAKHIKQDIQNANRRPSTNIEMPLRC